jgi:hypothetical protein
VWYGQKMVERLPRLRGEKRHHIQYRHIIEWLVRKPGAFENYRYRDDLFPTTRFRMAYDYLNSKTNSPVKQAREYLEILYLAANETESQVDNVLRILFDRGEPISVDTVKMLLKKNKNENQAEEWFQQILVKDVDLSNYDQLLSSSFPFPDAIATTPITPITAIAIATQKSESQR